jgi:peptidoglycan/xylan/chitin deacetylase (PgdA/CDA1 family)
MTKYSYNPPAIIKKIFKDFYWQTTNNKILLTFDDGPNPGTTEKILELLGSLNIKALHFCIGNNLKKYPALTNELISEGHTIGNHTLSHKFLTRITREAAKDELEKVNSILADEFNYNVKHVRPPYGRFNLSVRKLLNKSNLKVVMWNLVTYDYKNDMKKVKFAIDNYLQNNSIIVLHDSNKSKDIIIDSIKYITDAAAVRGFKFGEPEECLK